ncbi:hypothetical protein KKD81_02150 [Patescibacteria group bacterium]|nr:hypothetical protein [Patescibacteria group bacterium]MBU2158959.1 hypothetical protein [Patescibacteria group bacterium]MBU2220719.1 hypothetical protein [Patescibacteria group bacterium]
MKKIIVPVAVLIVAGVLIFFVLQPKAAEPAQTIQTDRTNREIALTCDPKMAQGFHVHPVLEIVVNGEKVAIPSNIGVNSTCMTVLHTHTPDGVIHVESPEKRDFTLADFFAVWDQPFSAQEILTNTTDATHRIRVTVDGTEVDTFENTVLKDAEHIVISYESL